MKKNSGNSNVVPGMMHFSSVIPSHILSAPEVRAVIKPREVIMYFPETVRREDDGNGNRLVFIDAINQACEPITLPLYMLDLNARQVNELRVFRRLSACHFAACKSIGRLEN